MVGFDMKKMTLRKGGHALIIDVQWSVIGYGRILTIIQVTTGKKFIQNVPAGYKALILYRSFRYSKGAGPVRLIPKGIR